MYLSCQLSLLTEEGSKVNTAKSLAIVVGGVAALVFVAIFFMFLKSLRKKGDGKLLLLDVISFYSIFFLI